MWGYTNHLLTLAGGLSVPACAWRHRYSWHIMLVRAPAGTSLPGWCRSATEGSFHRSGEPECLLSPLRVMSCSLARGPDLWDQISRLRYQDQARANLSNLLGTCRVGNTTFFSFFLVNLITIRIIRIPGTQYRIQTMLGVAFPGVIFISHLHQETENVNVTAYRTLFIFSRSLEGQSVTCHCAKCIEDGKLPYFERQSHFKGI